MQRTTGVGPLASGDQRTSKQARSKLCESTPGLGEDLRSRLLLLGIRSRLYDVFWIEGLRSNPLQRGSRRALADNVQAKEARPPPTLAPSNTHPSSQSQQASHTSDKASNSMLRPTDIHAVMSGALFVSPAVGKENAIWLAFQKTCTTRENDLSSRRPLIIPSHSPYPHPPLQMHRA